MSKNKELQHRCHCPHCGKVFDDRYEGFILDGHLVCANCYHKSQDNKYGHQFVKLHY